MASTRIVSISYSDLANFAVQQIKTTGTSSSDCVLESIAQAFGKDHENALGILAVTEVPTLSEKRRRLLPLARRLALLENKAAIVCEESQLSNGVESRKREMFDGKPDIAKGSFYANPLVDDIATLRQDVPREISDKNPGFFAPNVWPTESIPELKRPSKSLAMLVVGVGRLLAKPCDAYVAEHCPGYDPNKLTTLLEESKYCKARLLHYFAVDRTNATDTEFSDWCGWHNDHVSLWTS
jgi:hypothetical protein